MTYEQLFARASAQHVRVGLIGAGTFGVSLLAQSLTIPRLDVSVVCDKNVDTARAACLAAGLSPAQLVTCDSHGDVAAAVRLGHIAVVDDPALVADSAVDIVVEATGHPEAGACHAELAIKHGKHVAMVNKEADSVVGPVLKRYAAAAGLIYSPVDGDQHGLLIGLVSWARALGLDVMAAGKARPYDFVYDQTARTITRDRQTVILTQAEMSAFDPLGAAPISQAVRARREVLAGFEQVAEPDVCEAVLMANATGLVADMPTLHAPILRTTEIPQALCPEEEGGLLGKIGVVDVVNCLRRADEPGLGGGVFIVIPATGTPSWTFLKEKGLLTDQRGSYAFLYRPYHLLGVETPMTLLAAVLLGLSTGGDDVLPRVDLAARTRRDFKAGERIGMEHNVALQPLVLPATAIGPQNALPYFLAANNELAVDVPNGTVLTASMMREPEHSRLWALRREQDRVFGTAFS